MTLPNLGALAVLTIRQPAQAARVLLSLNIERGALWIALALAVVLNAFFFSLSKLLLPAVPSPIPGVLESPVMFGIFVGSGLLATIIAVYRVGAMLGGTGSFDDVMILMVWMQFLRVGVQALNLLLLLTVPLLSFLLAMASMVIGLFIFLHFIDQAHRLQSLGRAATVLIASVLAIVVALFLLLSLVGGPIMGSTPYV